MRNDEGSHRVTGGGSISWFWAVAIAGAFWALVFERHC